MLTVVGNPLISGANSSTYVGLYEDQPNQPWQALCIDLQSGADLSVYNQFSLQVLGDAAVPVLLKLEGGTSPGYEVWTATTKPGEWETITADFSSQVGTDHTRACIFLNAGVEVGTQDDYYLDNIQFAHADFTGCIINFDQPAFLPTEWNYFPADDSGAFSVVDNPDPSGINTSQKVGRAVEKASSGQPWQGMFTHLPAPIVFGDDKIVRMKVYSSKITTITMKIESPHTPGAPPSSGDNTVSNTLINEWEELSWDFNLSPVPIPDDGMYDVITLIFDILNIPAEDAIYYFDDVSLSTGECATVSSNGPQAPGDLTISPNPVSDQLTVEDIGRVTRLDVFSLYGQRVSSQMTGNASSTSFSVSEFPQGTYILAGYGSKGELIALSRFVKI